MDSILSIVPYRVLPATTGGHLGIVDLHHNLGSFCNDHMVSTVDNADESNYNFRIHRIFPATPKRYIPYAQYDAIKKIALSNNARYIYCDHPYMGFTAIKLSNALGISWFMRSHNIESERFKTLGKPWWRVMRWFERYMMRKADGVFFVTPEDAQWAITNYKLQASKAHVIPYGTVLSGIPGADAHNSAKLKLATALGINGDVPWLYFLGAHNYQPNSDAVKYILDEIVPRLDAIGFKYELLLAGKGLSEDLQDRINHLPNGRYLGFVPDLNDFLNACDIMLNPVMTGGGIKTKAVEALGYNKIVVSSVAGAAGLMPSVSGNNLHITADYDWDAFANKIIEAASVKPSVPHSFYNTYNWTKIAEKAIGIMQAAKA